jgi:malonyl-CoA decarboxylase
MAVSPQDLRAALETYEKGQTKTSYRAFMVRAAEPDAAGTDPASQPGAGRDRTWCACAPISCALPSGGRRELEALDVDFRHLFASWFNRGFLVLSPINWESPAHILEKIIAYEAVHAIDSWEDLRRRLVEPADRRCFAFFHPTMPDEPLIFVEVALTMEIPGSIQTLSERRTGDPIRADRRQYRGFLFHLELPGRACRHFLRQLADQAGRGRSFAWNCRA